MLKLTWLHGMLSAFYLTEAKNGVISVDLTKRGRRYPEGPEMMVFMENIVGNFFSPAFERVGLIVLARSL